ncbi:MAG: dTDP-4-dehydrorhamnose 3,5-epimerase family protein, partial [Cyanobium sp.]
MQVERYSIAGPVKITPRVYGDDRGYFLETWNQKRFAEALQLPLDDSPTFAQDNQSRSSHLVLRGL